MAPNPRRVHIFLAEMGFEELVQYKQVDMRKGESRSEELLQINPAGGIPVLHVPGQGGIAESVAICRYLVRVCTCWILLAR
jgi:glutathione S-transferase